MKLTKTIESQSREWTATYEAIVAGERVTVSGHRYWVNRPNGVKGTMTKWTALSDRRRTDAPAWDCTRGIDGVLVQPRVVVAEASSLNALRAKLERLDAAAKK